MPPPAAVAGFGVLDDECCTAGVTITAGGVGATAGLLQKGGDGLLGAFFAAEDLTSWTLDNFKVSSKEQKLQ